MISSLLIRSAALGAIGSLAWLSALTDIPDNPNLNKETGKYIPPEANIPKSASTFEELGIFEKHKGCKFVFVNDLTDMSGKKVTKAEKYGTDNIMKEIEKNYPKYKGWWKSVPESVWKYGSKNLCKKGEIVTLNSKGDKVKSI